MKRRDMLVGAFCLAISSAAYAQEEFARKIDRAIKQSTDYLYSKQRDTVLILSADDLSKPVEVQAVWKDVSVAKNGDVKVKGKTYSNVFAVLPPGWFAPEPADEGLHLVANVGGHTALTTFALLTAGANPNSDKRIQDALDCLLNAYCVQRVARPGAKDADLVLQQKLLGTYAIALRACAFEYALRTVRSPALQTRLRAALRADGLQLQSGFMPTAGFTYIGGGKEWDLSNTQYGILGLWAAARGNVPLNEATWRHFNRFLLDLQNPDGGWGYKAKEETTVTMTAAGVASLFVMMDLLHTRTRGSTKPDISAFNTDPLLLRTVQSIERSLDYWGRIWRATPDGYHMYGTERIGVASGRKYFGRHDWFREGAELLIEKQLPDGSWGSVLNTSWNLMFLVYGSAPVLINKLQYGPRDDWQWHNYPRDAANVASWYSRQFEQHANWQIIDLDATRQDDLLDAPILYINGHKAFEPSEVDVEILRRYVERGGTLLFVASGSSKAFADSVLVFGEKLYPPDRYPDRRFTAVPPAHPVFNPQGGKPDEKMLKIPVWHAHNGVRSFAFVVPEDINHIWHANRFLAKPEAFQIISGIRAYATDQATALPPKIRPLITSGETAHAGPNGKAIRLATVHYASKGVVMLQSKPGEGLERPMLTKGDWDSTALTWPVFGQWLRFTAGRDIEVERGVALAGDLSKYDVLHLSGHQLFAIGASDQVALRTFLNNGGSLIVDVPGGNGTAFHTTALDALRTMFPGQVENLAAGHPALSGAGGLRKLEAVEFTRQVKLSRTDVTSPTQILRGITIKGRPAVLITPFDLSLGLIGQTCWQRLGMDPAATRTIVANFLLASTPK